MSDPTRAAPSGKVLQAASRLRLDLAVLNLMEALEHADARSLLLKGPTLRAWLYDEHEDRIYNDCDLLVCPDDREAAEATLAALGYARDYDDRTLPDWWREHASAWVRDRDGVTVDLHRTLPGISVSEETTWEVLSRNPASIPMGNRQVPALSLAGRALHVALHATHHGSGLGTLTDLERALERGDERLWRDAAELAGELDALDAFVTGLAMSEPGRALIDRLELPEPRSIRTALYANQPPPAALGFEQLASAGSWSQRLSIVRHKLFPSREFIRHWDPDAPPGGLGLLRAYARRPIWLARHAGPGFSAWRRARRSVRGDQDT